MRLRLTAAACLAAALMTGCNMQVKKIDETKPLLGRICQRPNGKHYGVSEFTMCATQDKVVVTRPSTGFLGLQAESAINFDTAARQANAKTVAEMERRQLEENRLRIKEAEKRALDEERRIQPAVNAYIRGRKEGASHEGAVGYAAEVLEAQFGGNSYASWQKAREYIAPKLSKYDTPEWDAKLRGEQSSVDQMLDRLTEIRKDATRRIVANRNLRWESEGDPVRLSVVAELKGIMRKEVSKLSGTLSSKDIKYLTDELDKQIESNL